MDAQQDTGSVILVAAPNAALRRSIVFVLASERMVTEAHGDAASLFASARAAHAVCAVVDDEAIDDWRQAHTLFACFARPVILLVGIAEKVPDAPQLTQLVKPFLGEPLIAAVRAAMTGTR